MKTLRCIIFFIGFFLVANPLAVRAQGLPPTPRQVKDINTCTEGSNPYLLGEKDGVILFTVATESGPQELWRTDGTESGTQRITTFSPSLYRIIRSKPIWMNNYLYFFIDDSSSFTLWKTDGTEAGTQPASEIHLSLFDGLSGPVILKDKLYFILRERVVEGILPGALWESDGTAEGTHKIKDLAIHDFYYDSDLVVFQDHLFFTAMDEQGQDELWYSDGTAAGTRRFADPNTTGPSFPTHFTLGGDRLFFHARDENFNMLLWQSDGTVKGTKPISPMEVTPYKQMVYWDGILYFTGPDVVDGPRLWRTDGTAVGTWMVKDIPLEMSFKSTMGWGLVGGYLYFAANESELWQSDGTEAGTVRIKDLRLDEFKYYTPFRFFNVQGTVYFTALDWGDTSFLWRTDGTEAGTFPAINGTQPDNYVYTMDLMTIQNQLIFPGFASCAGAELMRIVDVPGQPPRSELVKDIETKTRAADFVSPTAYRGKFYFFADDGYSGSELWTSDGTEAGTFLLKDIHVGPKSIGGSTYPLQLVPAAGYLFFAAYNDHGVELWRTDGTQAGTQIVRDINPNNYGQGPRKLINFKDRLYFFQNVDQVERLWVSDGSAGGTTQIAAFPQELSAGSALINFNGSMYFMMYGSGGQQRLYRTDGTPEGTHLIHSGENRSSNRFSPVQAGNRLYFTAWDAQHGQELWQTDGTAEGTQFHTDLTPGPASTNFRIMTGTKTALYFDSIITERYWVVEWSLWKANPSTGAVERLMWSEDYPETGWVYDIKSSEDGVYFTLGEGIAETLWWSDGTKAGTFPLTDHKTWINDWTVVGNRVFFSSGDADHGQELWVSDGTSQGTHLAFDLRPGPESSHPGGLTFVGGQLWFTADDGLHGSEPWVYEFMTEKFYLPLVTQ